MFPSSITPQSLLSDTERHFNCFSTDDWLWMETQGLFDYLAELKPSAQKQLLNELDTLIVEQPGASLNMLVSRCLQTFRLRYRLGNNSCASVFSKEQLAFLKSMYRDEAYIELITEEILLTGGLTINPQLIQKCPLPKFSLLARLTTHYFDDQKKAFSLTSSAELAVIYPFYMESYDYAQRQPCVSQEIEAVLLADFQEALRCGNPWNMLILIRTGVTACIADDPVRAKFHDAVSTFRRVFCETRLDWLCFQILADQPVFDWGKRNEADCWKLLNHSQPMFQCPISGSSVHLEEILSWFEMSRIFMIYQRFPKQLNVLLAAYSSPRVRELLSDTERASSYIQRKIRTFTVNDIRQGLDMETMTPIECIELAERCLAEQMYQPLPPWIEDDFALKDLAFRLRFDDLELLEFLLDRGLYGDIIKKREFLSYFIQESTYTDSSFRSIHKAHVLDLELASSIRFIVALQKQFLGKSVLNFARSTTQTDVFAVTTEKKYRFPDFSPIFRKIFARVWSESNHMIFIWGYVEAMIQALKKATLSILPGSLPEEIKDQSSFLSDHEERPGSVLNSPHKVSDSTNSLSLWRTPDAVVEENSIFSPIANDPEITPNNVNDSFASDRFSESFLSEETPIDTPSRYLGKTIQKNLRFTSPQTPLQAKLNGSLFMPSPSCKKRLFQSNLPPVTQPAPLSSWTYPGVTLRRSLRFYRPAMSLAGNHWQGVDMSCSTQSLPTFHGLSAESMDTADRLQGVDIELSCQQALQRLIQQNSTVQSLIDSYYKVPIQKHDVITITDADLKTQALQVVLCRVACLNRPKDLMTCIIALRELNIDFNAQDKHTGKTALHFAAEKGHRDICAILTAQPEIDVRIQDNQGRTAAAIWPQGGSSIPECLIQPIKRVNAAPTNSSLFPSA